MPICSNCGNETPTDERFCRSCGKEHLPFSGLCKNCGKTLDKTEKFCSSCGTRVSFVSNENDQTDQTQKEEDINEVKGVVRSAPEILENKRKLITHPAKKKGKIGSRFKTLFIITVILIVGIIAIYYTTNWFEKDKGHNNSSIAGVVNIKPGIKNSNELPKNNAPEVTSKTTVEESKELKTTTEILEKIFADADTIKLKQMLTESSLKRYSRIFGEIQKYMPEYAKAFKNRKLVKGSEVLKVYEYSGSDGKKYTVEFEYQANGSWKLVRF